MKDVTFYELRPSPHTPLGERWFADNIDTLLESVRISYGNSADKIEVRPAMVGDRWTIYENGREVMAIVTHRGRKLEHPEHL